MTTVTGFAAPAFAPVAEAFRTSFTGRPTMGGALTVLHRGEVVVDLWGGVADLRSTASWQEDTLSVIFSCTKGLCSLLAAQLVEDGVFRYEDKVASVWPEFAAAGKADVTIADLLSHRSGLSAPRAQVRDLTQWAEVTAQLAAQEPLWEPGTAHSYHAITHGFLIGEVMRRATGMSVGSLLQQRVSQPLGVDAWIGIPPALQDRVAHVQTSPAADRASEEAVLKHEAGELDWNYEALTLGGALPYALVGDDDGFNNPAIQAAEVPGAGGITNARALATIWSATVTETAGVRLLSDAILDRALVPQSEGPQLWAPERPWARWGMGFQLDSEARRYVGANSFGHDGAGGQVAFADPDHQIGFAFVTNYLEHADDPRGTAIVDALRTALTA